MKKNTMDRFIGKYCKIVTKESDKERAHVVIGTVKDVDHTDGFLLVESNQGTSCLNIKTIVAIKPKEPIRV